MSDIERWAKLAGLRVEVAEGDAPDYVVFAGDGPWSPYHYDIDDPALLPLIAEILKARVRKEKLASMCSWEVFSVHDRGNWLFTAEATCRAAEEVLGG